MRSRMKQQEHKLRAKLDRAIWRRDCWPASKRLTMKPHDQKTILHERHCVHLVRPNPPASGLGCASDGKMPATASIGQLGLESEVSGTGDFDYGFDADILRRPATAEGFAPI